MQCNVSFFLDKCVQYISCMGKNLVHLLKIPRAVYIARTWHCSCVYLLLFSFPRKILLLINMELTIEYIRRHYPTCNLSPLSLPLSVHRIKEMDSTVKLKRSISSLTVSFLRASRYICNSDIVPYHWVFRRPWNRVRWQRWDTCTFLTKIDNM